MGSSSGCGYWPRILQSLDQHAHLVSLKKYAIYLSLVIYITFYAEIILAIEVYL